MDDSFSIRKIVIFATIGIIVVIIRFLISAINTGDMFVMCDVGQGDGMYLRIDKVDVVIDAGKDNRMSQCLGRHMIFFDRQIELLFITNSDFDHYGGIDSLINHYLIKRVLVTSVADNDVLYFKLLKKLRLRGSSIEVFHAGDTVKIGSKSKITSLWPTSRIIDFEDNQCTLAKNSELAYGFKVICSDINRFSQVFWLDLFEKNKPAVSFLFTGDITGEEVDNYLTGQLKKHVKGQKVFLKVPHHGSKNGLTSKLLDAIDPTVAFISAGKNNRYGHPHKNIVDLLKMRSIKYFVTLTSKDIIYRVNNGMVVLEK